MRSVGSEYLLEEALDDDIVVGGFAPLGLEVCHVLPLANGGWGLLIEGYGHTELLPKRFHTMDDAAGGGLRWWAQLPTHRRVVVDLD